jgi:hypothetical protein
MNNLFYVLCITAICCAAWGTVASIMITSFLDKRGIKTPFFLLRLYILRNISRYRKITVAETGRPGELYYHCVLAFNAALLLGLIALAVRFF